MDLGEYSPKSKILVADFDMVPTGAVGGTFGR
jgi:hypothetical protein